MLTKAIKKAGGGEIGKMMSDIASEGRSKKVYGMGRGMPMAKPSASAPKASAPAANAKTSGAPVTVRPGSDKTAKVTPSADKEVTVRLNEKPKYVRLNEKTKTVKLNAHKNGGRISESTSARPRTASGRELTMADLEKANRDTGGMNAAQVKAAGQAIGRGNRAPYEKMPVKRAAGGAGKMRKGMMK